MASLGSHFSPREYVVEHPLDTTGIWIDPSYLPAQQCRQLLARVEAERRRAPAPVIHRAAVDRPLHYAVLDGDRIRAQLPEVLALHRQVNTLVSALLGEPLVPLDDARVACNINITGPGGTYRWHYDRNAVTAILYLNAVDGGQTECYPNYRLRWPGGSHAAPQRWLDRALQTPSMRALSGRHRLIEPTAGKLLVMRGDRCLHSVRPVAGDADRINIVMSYDRPGAIHAMADGLNAYLYRSSEPGPPGASPTTPRDPNYTR